MQVALVHDWLVAHRGGEQVLLELARMHPGAPIFTLVCAPERIHPELRNRTIYTSRLQDLPGVPRRFRHLLPFFTQAIESFDLADFDCVISTSHCVAKGVKTQPWQRHISYIHTPMRYLWDGLESYLPRGLVGRVMRPWAEWFARPLRRWDVESAQRPDFLLANSENVKERIERLWGRGCSVVYPPVDTEFFTPGTEPRGRELLVLGAQVPYKNARLAVTLASRRGLPLRVLGDGPVVGVLRRLAGPTVVFEPSADRERVREAYRQARALLFCGIEDFGIVPVEAMACGCPVVALARGGALETVVGEGEGRTGVFFDEPTEMALNAALAELERVEEAGGFSVDVIRARALGFSVAGFRRGMAEAAMRIAS